MDNNFSTPRKDYIFFHEAIGGSVVVQIYIHRDEAKKNPPKYSYLFTLLDKMKDDLKKNQDLLKIL